MNGTTAAVNTTPAPGLDNDDGGRVFDLEAELMDLAALADFLDVAAAAGDTQAHSAMLYAGRRLAEHRDALHRGFETMFHAHHDELAALRVKLAEAETRAAPGSQRDAERLDSARRVLLAAADTTIERLRAVVP